VDPEAFEIMIKAMYTDDLDAENDNVMELLFCCDKFGFDFGKQQCIRLLRENLTVENAAVTYDKSPGLLQDEKYILDFVDENAEEVIHQDSFLNLSSKTVLDIVQRPKLQVDEGDLLKVVLKWAERECERQKLEATGDNLKQILHHIVPYIRFPVLSIQDFADLSLRGILSPEDQLSVFHYLGTEEHERKGLTTPFLTKARAQSLKKSLYWGKVHRLFILSSDKKSVTYNGAGARQHVTAVGEARLKSGRYRIRMEHRGGWTYSLGICTEKHSLETALGRDSESWALTYMGQLLHNGVERGGYGPNLSHV